MIFDIFLFPWVQNGEKFLTFVQIIVYSSYQLTITKIESTNEHETTLLNWISGIFKFVKIDVDTWLLIIYFYCSKVDVVAQ